ncbi:MAG: Ribosome-binding factor A [Candidatus Wolfebacteria bacterium GW2011_GWE1_48_7]|nr:MAG: Ribosome-binding factor A [Candidatus Wolfebacteria bacterium GW2011_GWE1_48_7]
MKYRKERLSNLIEEELSNIIVRELEFDGALVTITGVELSEDSDFADVKFSVLPSTKAKEVSDIFKKNAGHLQHILIRKLSMRSIPYIRFEYDPGLDKAQKVEKILMEEIEKGEGVSKYITGNLSRFAIIFLGSLAIYALFLPAVFVKLEYLYEGTIGSPTLKSFSLPFTAFLLLLLADAKLMKANVTKSVSLFLNANQNTILRILAASFLGIILLLSLNSWTGERIIPLENIKEEAYVDDELLFPMIEGRNGLTVFVKKFAAQLYPLTFSLLPLQLILLVAMLLGIIAGKFYKFKSFTFFLLMFTFVYVFGALVSDVFLNPRYSIMLYPLYALFSAITIHGISVYFKNKKKFFISMSLLVIISGSVSLWLVKPFPFAYANFFLPKNQVITDSWGYGEYEAAQYLNSLPEAENIVIWSDLSGICQFFKGKCLKSYKIDLSKTAPDYFVFSRRGAIRHPFVWEKPELAKNSTSYYYGKIPDGFEWAVYVGGREDNFVKIIKVEEK